MKMKEIYASKARSLFKKAPLSVLIAALSSTGMAAELDQKSNHLEEVIVTGSFIKRSQANTASPIQVIGNEGLSKIGATSVSDIVNSLTINTGAQVYTDSFEQARSSGTTNINLRGLGVTSTLILVNNRRHTLTPAVDEGGNQFVDLSTLIPAIAIDRVEILKDGASSLHGSDAVAGVVNFITRSDFEGFEVDVNYQNNRYGSDEVNLGAIFGGGNESGRFMLAVNHLKRTSVPNSERRSDYADNQDSWSGYGFPGKVLSFDGPPGPPTRLIDPVCLDGSAFEEFPGLVRRTPDGAFPSDGSCQLNFGFYGDIIAAAHQTQVFMQGSIDLGERTELFTEAGFGRNVTTISSVPSQPQLDPAFVPGHHPDAILIGGPDPFPGSASNSGVLFLRPFGAGSPPNVSDKEYQSWRYQIGLRGDLENDWSWELALTRSINEATNTRIDQITENLQAALDGNGPGGDGYYHWLTSTQDQNTQEMYDFILGEFGYAADSGQTVYDGHISGNLFELSSGSVGAAFGIQYRKDTLSYDFNERSEERAFNFFGGGNDFSASQDVFAAFVELSVPISSQIEIQAAVRYEDFDSVSTTDPKLAVLWTPSENLSLRASYSSSFRVATVFQNFSEFVTPQSANDPLQGGDEFSFISLLTGDPDRPLTPQESTALNAGFTWNADFGLNVSIDYWNFDYTDYITAETAQALLNTDPNGPQITRGADGAPIAITTFYRNAGSLKTDGVDFDISFDMELGDKGTLTPFVGGTYILSYDLQDPIAGKIDGLGNVNDENFGVSTVELRSNFGLRWNTDNHAANIIARYIGEYENDNENNATVDRWVKIDAQYAFTLPPLFGTNEGATVTLGVLNLFDEEAPTVRNSIGYDATVHDPRGRMIYMNVKYPFL